MAVLKKNRIKKGDKVIVIAGKNKGKTGKVSSIISKKSRIIVSGIAIVKKHQKANQKNDKGGIIEKESSIHYSNVMMYSSKLEKGVRISVEEKKDKNPIRYCAKTKETF